MKRLVVIFFLLLCVLPLSSQIFKERRIIKMTALELFESYQDVYNRLYQSNKNVYIYDQFINLFSDSAKLYNDLIFDHIDSFELYMSPAKYFEIVEKETKENSLKGEFKDYSDLRLDSISENKKYWIINLSFKRRVEFSMGGTLYPYKGYPPLSYTIKIKMSKNLKKGGNRFKDAKIISVSVSNPPTGDPRFLVSSFNKGDTVPHPHPRGMPEGYLPPDIDLDKEAQRDSNSSIFNKLTYVCRYDLKKDRGENVVPQDKHFYVTSYKKSDFAGVGIDVCPYGFGNKISDANKKSGYDNISQNNFTMGVSIFYGLNILSKKRYSLFFVPQLNLNYRRFDYKGTYKTQYQSVDADGSLYIRNINIELNKETVNQFLINIPVVVSNMFLLHKDDDGAHQLFFSLDCGIQFSCSPITRNHYDFLADYTGLYDFFGGVEFDHYYDYGNFNLTQNDIHYIPNSLINKFNLGVLVGVGVLYQIHENSLIKFSLSYRNEFLSVAKYKEGFVLSKDFSSFESLIQASKLGAHNLYFSLSFVRALDRNSED